MSRNGIDKDEIIKMLKKNVPHPDEKKFGISDMDFIADQHTQLLIEMAKACPHVTRKFLHIAVNDTPH